MHNKIKQLLIEYNKEKDSGLYKALEEVSKEYENIYNELLEKNRKVEEYDVELRAMNAELNEANEKLVVKNTRLEEFDAELREMNEEFKATNEKLKQKNIQLEEYRTRLEATMRAGNLAWWEMNIITGAVRFNEQKTKMLGYKTKDFKHYTDFTNLVHPDDYEPMMEAMRECINTTLIYSIDYRIKASNGAYKWFHDIGVVTATDDNGKPLVVTGVVIDITRRKNTEEKLRQREEKFRNLFDNMNDMVFIHDMEGYFKEVNHKAVIKTGYLKHELLKMNVLDLDKQLDPNVKQDLLSKIEQQGFALFDSKLFTKQDVPVPTEVHARKINYEGKAAVLSISRDITERKKHEKQLKQRIKYEEKLAHFSNTLLLSSKNSINRALEYILDASATSSIYIFENFTDENGALCMKQTYEICAKGVKPEINKPQLQHLDYKKDGLERWKEELSNNNIIKGSIEDFPKKEQDILSPQHIQSILVIPIWVNKEWFGFIGFDDNQQKRQWSKDDIRLLRTISEIIGIYIENRQKEKAIISQNKELQKLNATKDKFFSIIAHDLKNPFTTLLGMSESLMNNYNQYPDEKRKEQIQAIGDSSKKTFKLLETLLVWSRTQTGRIKFNPQEIALDDLISENIHLFSNVANAKNICLEKDITNGIFVKGDYEMLNTVIRNLLSNAIKFTPEGGKVKVGSKNKNKDEVLCYVKDTGIGITPENKKKLFRIDQNFSCKGTNQEKGTGLGLILSKEFIEKHGGEIGVVSKPKEGATFYFTLKKVKKQEVNMDNCFLDPKKLTRDICKSEEIKNEFINQVIPVFKETNGKYSAKGIKKFALVVKDFGGKHNISQLIDFAIRIEKYLESFDIPKINACFAEFEKNLNPRSG